MFLIGHLQPPPAGDRPAPPPPAAPPRDDVRALLRESLELSQALIDIQSAKASLLARHVLARGISVVLTVLALVTLTVASTWFALEGLAGGLQAACERAPWVGPLAVGLVGLSIGPILLTILHRTSERAVLRKLDRRSRATGPAAAP